MKKVILNKNQYIIMQFKTKTKTKTKIIYNINECQIYTIILQM